MSDDFKQLVASSPALLERWTRISDAYILEAKRAGIAVTKEDLATLSSVKIEVISGQQVGDWREDAKLNLPAFKAAQELRDLKEAIASEDAVTAANAADDLNALSPGERMNLGRTLGVSTKVAPSPELSAADKAHHIKIAEGLRGGARLAYSRKYLGGA